MKIPIVICWGTINFKFRRTDCLLTIEIKMRVKTNTNKYSRNTSFENENKTAINPKLVTNQNKIAMKNEPPKNWITFFEKP